MNHMKPSPSIKKPHHYINMHPNSLYVSLDFGQIYHCKSGQSPSKKRLVATDNWINSLVISETKLLSNETNSPNHFIGQ